MRLQTGDTVGARRAWERSLCQTRSAWSLRNLALLEQREGNTSGAADLWLEAHRLLPGLVPLAVECAQALLRSQRPDGCVALIAGLRPELAASGRFRYLEALARLDLGEFDAVETILRRGLVLDDLREGECSLTDLWFGLHERRLAARECVAIDDALRQRVRQTCPPPAHLEFRGSST
jgi:hypothetical protein